MKVPLLHKVLDIIKNEEYSLSHDIAIDSFCGSITSAYMYSHSFLVQEALEHQFDSIYHRHYSKSRVDGKDINWYT